MPPIAPHHPRRIALYHNGSAPPLAKHTRPRHQHGLTLIELLVTIAVLAVLVTQVLPSYQRFVARNEVAAEVMRIKTALALARNTAITRRTTITVCPSTDKLMCNNRDWSLPLILIQGRADGGNVDGNILKVWKEGSVPDVTYRNDNRPIRYNFLGRPAGHNGTFKICGKNGTGTNIVVSNFGRVRTDKNIPDNC